MWRRVLIINRRFGGTCPFHIQSRINKASKEKCQTVANRLTLFLSRVIPYTLTKDATRSSETSVYNKLTRPHILEDSILHSHLRQNLKSWRIILLKRYRTLYNINLWSNMPSSLLGFSCKFTAASSCIRNNGNPTLPQDNRFCLNSAVKRPQCKTRHKTLLMIQVVLGREFQMMDPATL
jgi:hypothetical protein